MPADAVLLIGFGGPNAEGEIRPYLQNVVRGRRVPPERLEEVAHHYEELGGRSPYNALTLRQAEALHQALAARGRPLPVYVGMRNWAPYLSEALAAMRDAGVRRAVGVVLAPHRTFASWEQYQQNVEDARAEIGAAGTPAIDYLGPWHTEPGFLEAQAARIEESTGYRRATPPRRNDGACGGTHCDGATPPRRNDGACGGTHCDRGAWPPGVPLLFTAHSVPVEMADASSYVAQIGESAAGIAGLMGAERFRVVYQSRSGDPRQPWLEPDVNDALREEAAGGAAEVVLVPVGFLCDHVEVLYDLDVEAKQTAAEVGLRLHRAGTVGDHPRFIAMLAVKILERA
jgi:ferrochelatase